LINLLRRIHDDAGGVSTANTLDIRGGAVASDRDIKTMGVTVSDPQWPPKGRTSKISRRQVIQTN
jgi:hypothetical protein